MARKDYCALSAAGLEIGARHLSPCLPPAQRDLRVPASPQLRHSSSSTQQCVIVRPMPVSDLDIARSAHLYIQLHGDDAIVKAREMVEAGHWHLAARPRF